MNAPTYPLPSHLPERLEKLVLEIIRATKAPYAMVVNTTLGGMVSCLQHNCSVQHIPDSPSPVSLFLLTIADSGERKSTVQSLVFRAITETQRQWRKDALQNAVAHKMLYAVWRKKLNAQSDVLRRAMLKGEPIDEIEKQLGIILEAEPKLGLERKLIYMDTTIEALLVGLHESCGKSAVLLHDEFGQFCDGPMARHQPTMNALWSGTEIPVHRKTSGTFVLEDAKLSAVLLAQPSVFKRFLDKQGNQARGNGFLARFLIAYPPSTQGSRVEDGVKVDCPTLDWFYARCKELLHKDNPRLLKFSPRARTELVNVANFYESYMRPGGIYYSAKDFASKATENIARLAAIFHAFFTDNDDEITSETLNYAINLIATYGQQYLTILGASNPADEEQQDLMDLTNWLLACVYNKQVDCIPKSYLMQYGPNRLRQKAKLDVLLGILASHGKIRIMIQSNKKYIYPVIPNMVRHCFNPNQA
ncbi:YfjI family protein [Simplicispira piscis]